jgi:hypothetical protein
VTAEAVIATSLDDENLEGLDDYGVMMMLAKAQKELADWGEGIFGRVDDRGGQVQIRIARNSAEAARDATEAELKSSDKTLAFQRDGKLGEHIGYAPVFKDGRDLDLTACS